jgi:beta-phosphoglucomutase-like phosphatase (HAD superfamily)
MKLDIAKYRAFFFDFDGVIVDSLDIKTQAFGGLFKKYGRNISRKVMEYHRNNGGVSRYEKFKYYYKNLLNKNINQKIIRGLDRKYSHLVFRKVVSAPFVKGALNLLRKLNKSGKACFIISGTPQKEIHNIVRKKKIAQFFCDIVGSPKSKVENLKILLQKHSIRPSEAIYFGDAKSDYEAAKEYKVRFVGIANNNSKELEGMGAIQKIKDFIIT